MNVLNILKMKTTHTQMQFAYQMFTFTGFPKILRKGGGGVRSSILLGDDRTITEHSTKDFLHSVLLFTIKTNIC